MAIDEREVPDYTPYRKSRGRSSADGPIVCCLFCCWVLASVIIELTLSGASFTGSPLQAIGLAAFVIGTIVFAIWWFGFKRRH